MKKEDIKVITVMLILMILLTALFIWKFNDNTDKCDKEMGYKCSASQIIEYNKKVD